MVVVVAGVGVRLLLLAAELALPADCHQDWLLAGPERGHQPHHRAGLQRTTVRADTTYRLSVIMFTFIVSKSFRFPLPIQSLQSPGAVQCGCWRGTGRGTRAGRRWCRWRGCSPRSGTRSSPTTGRVSAAAAVRRGVMCSLVRPGRALRRGRGQPRPVEIQADRGGRVHAHGVGGKRHAGAGAKLSCSKNALDR